MSNLNNSAYNPDVLSCLANLSNDEVFTPPEVANAMLDLLPQEIFSNPNAKFLDPACKSGVFLREIAKRLIEGLKDKIPDLQERVNHIFKTQLYAIAITELTSLLARRSVYCSKDAGGKYSVAQFGQSDGNIFYEPTKHLWVGGKCLHCGASQSEYGNETREGLESHAYQFIHNAIPGEIENMKFDVIIGNPPYQLSDGGNGKSAKPIYHLFVNEAKKLKPRYLVMIIPSRWFTGGKGLEDFRKTMLNDSHILQLIDYENFKDVFPGVDLAGGACYFLWDRDHKDDCIVSNYKDGQLFSSKRKLNEFETFIRQNLAVEIVRKIVSANKLFLSERVSSRKPFGMPTNYEPRKSGIPCWFIQKIGLQYADKNDVDDSNKYLDKWKFIVPKAPIAGQTDFSKPVGFYYEGNTKIAKPGECCTESFIVLGAFTSSQEVESFKSYIFTKTVRFLLLQTVVSQDVTKKNFCFIPDLEKYDHHFTDKELCKKWNITDDEWQYIDSRICNIGQ
ncbi:MAG: Eco57I restriction-modification methylase domain-containing protein [Spirochaetaceae bacterium]|nr:Eco57I restriction-modification methylase domain-containing protein [Spirochaetaceae bacterium]